MLRESSTRSAGVDADILELSRQLLISDGVSQKQDALRSNFQRCFDKSNAAKDLVVYSRVQDDRVKSA